MTETDIARYEAALRRLSTVAGLLNKEEVRENNRLMNVAQSLYLVLRQTVEGRQTIERLTTDPDRKVRLSAATHALAWNPKQARPVLEQLRDDDSDKSLAGFGAKYVLLEYDAGRLNLDWAPRTKR